MYEEPTGTKLDLILAAGQIFAEHGLEGASVRAIAEKAGANIAAINYHFGSKENLFREVLIYTHEKSKHLDSREILKDQQGPKSRDEVTDIIRTILISKFRMIFFGEPFPWHGRLIIRSLLDPSPVFLEVVKEVFIPDNRAIQTFAKTVNPAMSDLDAHFWSLSLVSHIVLFSVSPGPILMAMGMDEFDENYIEGLVEFATRTIVDNLYNTPTTPEKE